LASKQIRVGVVGAGANTRQLHIPRLKAIDGVEVVSVANRSRASGEKVAQEFNIPTVYDNWRDLVEAPDTDAIVIGTWPYLHCPVTLAALAAGKHVLTEARMAMDAEEAHKMLAAAREHPKQVTMIVPSPFTLNVDAAIQKHVAEGFLGEIIGVEVRGATPGFPQTNRPMTWRENRDLSGLNVLNMGIWYEAAMRWVGEATRVMARTRVVVHQRPDPDTGEPRQLTVPDHVEILADMAFGGVGHFHFSAVTGFARPPEAWIHGTDGTLRYDQASRTLFAGRRGDAELAPVDIPPELQGGWRVEEEFVGAIRGEAPVRRTTFEDGVRYMEFTEAVAISAASGRSVALPLVTDG
jgi:predicted dehydrogenase